MTLRGEQQYAGPRCLGGHWQGEDQRSKYPTGSDPYVLDGGGRGASEDDGSYFLLSYWMGRYHGFISPVNVPVPVPVPVPGDGT